MSTDPALWRRANESFDALLDLDPAARGERLAQWRNDDPALAQAVERLLAADAQDASGLLDHGVDALSPTLVERLRQPAEDAGPGPAPGESIGPFKLVRRLGQGGMGEVFLAQRSDTGFEQQVALKLLKRGMDSAEVLRRFVQERRILARLNHPHIARFVDGGLAANGQPWYAMEYVDGKALTEYAQASGLDVRNKVLLLAQVCDAVAYAHTQLVVHRDLKPSNILVDANGQPRVLDFGIAKLLDEADDAGATATGSRVMSPAYAAPEQVLGEPVGTPTDVYALGVVLFELLTGDLPHQRSGRSPEALARDVSAEVVARPSHLLRQTRTDERGATSLQRERSARELVGDLDTVVLAALQREPARRYPTAAALADDLRRWLDGRPIAARPDTARYRMTKFVRRHRGAVMASLATVLALIGGFGIALWQASVAREQAQRADLEAQRAASEAMRAEAQAATAREMTQRARRVKDFLMSVFAQEDPLRRDARGALTMAEAFEDSLRRIDTEFADDPALQGDLLDDFGEILTNKGDFDRADPLFVRALANAERSRGPDDPAVAETLLNQAALSNWRGHLAQARPALERAVAILEPYRETEPAALANAYMSLAVLLRNDGKLAEATRITRVALELFGGPDSNEPGRLIAMYNLATMLTDASGYAEAEPLLRKAIAGFEASQGTDAVPLIMVLSSLEQVVEQRGDLDELMRLAEQRLAIADKHLPADHPWRNEAASDVGWYLWRAGKTTEGEARLREAIADYDRRCDHDVTAVAARRRLASILRRTERAPEALAVLDVAMAQCRDSEAANNLMCLTVRANRGWTLADTGDAAGGLAEADAALKQLDAAFATAHDERGQAFEARAAALAALGRNADAVAAQTEAVSLYRSVYGDAHTTTRAAQERLDAMQPARSTSRG